ncbi:MAG: DUF1080 domain-containing protein [Bacteroidales bacterium]|nr:DUF1080 domain-containing protein [Bacteroidales bacterium]
MKRVTGIFMLILLVAGYSCRPKEKSSVKAEISFPRDEGWLFDGKSLNGWEITNFGPQGPVSVSDGNIVLGMGDGSTGITWKEEFPVDNYEVSLEAMKVDGNDFFCGLTFPVGKDPCTLIVGGWGGTVVGLSSINGMDASENETSTLMQFEKDRWYGIRVRVAGGKIQAWIDEEQVVDFTIGDNMISIRPEVELSKPFGIASWHTTAALRNIRVEQGGIEK